MVSHPKQLLEFLSSSHFDRQREREREGEVASGWGDAGYL